MLKRWPMTIAAILAWLLVCGLALVVIMVGAIFYQLFIVLSLNATRWTIQFMVQVYYVLMGLLWLGLVIWMDHLLITIGNRTGQLLKRTLFGLGIEVAAIALIQIGTMLYRPIEFWQMATTAAEALLGAGLIYFSRRKKKVASPEMGRTQ